MSRGPGYFKLGLFVIFGTALIMVGVVVFGSGVLREEKFYFETYFDNSVSGLNVGAAVESRGVRIGRVEEVTFVTNKYDIMRENGFTEYQKYVMVVCSADIEKLPRVTREKGIDERVGILVENGFRLQLASNLLTGQAYIDAVFLDPNKYLPLDITWEPEHIYIPSAPSVIMTFKESITRIMEKLEKLDFEKLNKRLTDVLGTVDKAVRDANVGKLSDEIYALLSEARETNEKIQELVTKPEDAKELENLPLAIDQLHETLSNIDKLVEATDPKISGIMRDLKVIGSDLKQVIRDLKQTPSDLIFSRPPEKSEVLE